MDQAAIGSRIKAARERAHLTQEQLAEIVDISPTHMSVIERGVKTPKLDTFVRIANALGVLHCPGRPDPRQRKSRQNCRNQNRR